MLSLQLVSAAPKMTNRTHYCWSCLQKCSSVNTTLWTLPCFVFFLEETFRVPKSEPSSSHEQPPEKPPEEPQQDQRPRRLKKNYNCPTCGRVFAHNTALQRHLVIHSGKKPYKCFICGRGFTQNGNLKTHMKVHKGQRQREATFFLIICFYLHQVNVNCDLKNS